VQSLPQATDHSLSSTEDLLLEEIAASRVLLLEAAKAGIIRVTKSLERGDYETDQGIKAAANFIASGVNLLKQVRELSLPDANQPPETASTDSLLRLLDWGGREEW
jgi:uncharacterized protein involved in exopolysaccharide biosynthesis